MNAIHPFSKLETTVIDHSRLGRCVRITGFRLVDLPNGPHLWNDGTEVVTTQLSAYGNDIDAATNAGFDTFMRLFVHADGSEARGVTS